MLALSRGMSVLPPHAGRGCIGAADVERALPRRRLLPRHRGATGAVERRRRGDNHRWREGAPEHTSHCAAQQYPPTHTAAQSPAWLHRMLIEGAWCTQPRWRCAALLPYLHSLRTCAAALVSRARCQVHSLRTVCAEGQRAVAAACGGTQRGVRWPLLRVAGARGRLPRHRGRRAATQQARCGPCGA